MNIHLHARSRRLASALVTVGAIGGLLVAPGGWTASANDDPGEAVGESRPVPPGQLSRRGLSGPVVAASESSIVVATNFGNVTVSITGGTIIRRPPEGLVTAADIQVGDRVAVLLDRSPIVPPDDGDEDGDDADTDGSTDDADTAPDEGSEGRDEAPDANEGSDDEQAPDANEENEDETEAPDQGGQSDDDGEAPDVNEGSPDGEDEAPSQGGQSGDDGDAPDANEESGDDTQSPGANEGSPDGEGEDPNAGSDDGQQEGEDGPDSGSTPDDGSSDGEAADEGDADAETPEDGESDDSGSADVTPPSPSFREATALHITIIPGKPSRSHVHGVVKEKAKGRVTVIAPDGSEEELDAETLDASQGDDMLFIVTGGRDNGPRKATAVTDAETVSKRLEALAGNAPGNPSLSSKLESLRQETQERRVDRIEQALEKSGGNDAVKRALEKARGDADETSSQSRGISDRDTDNSGNSARSDAAPGNGNGNGGNQDRGNSGNAPGGGRPNR